VWPAAGANGGLYPMARGRRNGHCTVAMKFPNEPSNEAGANERAAREGEANEPLFGDERWIEERLRILQGRRGPEEGQAAA
jgi:hypothetical protein